MPTGACGINCDTCRLKLLTICSSCGDGKSPQAKKKLEAQKRILGGTCPILACASLNGIAYCLRDCDAFPCDNFQAGPYPFSQGFLNMQKRRRQERPPALTPDKALVQVPSEYWDALEGKDLSALCRLVDARPYGSGGLLFSSLGEEIVVDTDGRCLRHFREECWQVKNDPLFELLTLLYLNRVGTFHAVGTDIVGLKELKEAHYFKGPHALDLGPLLERFGNDAHGFKQAAQRIGGKALDMADTAFAIFPFPRIPLYYLLWEGDEEFRPKFSILFDRSIEESFSASAVWMLVNMVSSALLQGTEIRSFD